MKTLAKRMLVIAALFINLCAFGVSYASDEQKKQPPEYSESSATIKTEPVLEYKMEEAGIKQVVEMMMNPQVEWIVISEHHLSETRVPVSTKFRQDRDTVMAIIFPEHAERERELLQLKWKWPVKFDGRSFEYRYEGSKPGVPNGVKGPSACGYYVTVKGEIISINPPQIKIIAERIMESPGCISMRDTSKYIYELRWKAK